MSPKYLKNTAVFLVSVVIFGVFVSCENPFTRSLGEKVDVEWPTVSVLSPAVGSIINKEVTFGGRATAYREVDRVEVRILNPDKYSAAGPLLNWTYVSNVSSGNKEVSWNYRLDTAGPIFTGQDDGFLYIQFRAWDNHDLVVQDENVQTYVYIIKNKPSMIKMSAPTDDSLNNGSAFRETKTDIRGQIIDRRGIKPGFPRIKIWAAGTAEPGDADWVTLFLVGNGDDVIDTVDDINGWSYGDRSQMKAIQQAIFVYKLAEIDHINPTTDADGNEIREAVYKMPFVQLTPKSYHFRIWTSDTYFYTDEDIRNGLNGANASMKQWPREPNPYAAAPETVLVGFSPEIPGYQPGVDDPAPYVTSGNYWTLEVKSAGQDPDIALDYSYLGSGLSQATIDTLLAAKPNVYISESSSQKISTGAPTRIVFKLGIKATHPDGINPIVNLKWEQPGSSNSGTLDTTSEFPFSDANGAGRICVFEATESQFPSSPRPYMLSVTAAPTGSPDRKVTKTYNVLVSSSKPTVKIESITGAASEMTETPVSGTNTHTINYLVNGNIEISTSSAAAMGMNTEGGFDLVKWIVESAGSATTLNAINLYNTTPNADNLNFFNNIPNTASASASAVSGRVGTTGSFRFNTENFGTEDLWLYVIAQDSVQNLGYIRVKLRVDQSSDKPTLQTPGLFSTTEDPSSNSITSVNDLFIGIDSDKTQVNTSQTRRNILDRDTGIDLTFKDDDGIRLQNITIKLTDLNKNTNVTIPLEQIESMLSGSKREWSGMLSQRIMAAAMANNGSNLYLRDGIYKLEITYTDNAADKVTISGTANTSLAGTPKTFYFCVMNNQPTITITSPEKNTFVNMSATEIKGEITSYIPVQKIWISFNPALASTPNQEVDLWRNYNKTNDVYSDKVTLTNSVANTTTGVYTYYWHITGVLFGSTSDTSEDRRFTLEAYDNLGGPFEEPWSVKIDKSPPKVELAEFFYDRPLETNKVNGKFNFIINVTDNNGIQTSGTNNVDVHVRWWIKASGDPIPTWAENVIANGTSGQFTTAAQVGANFTHIITSGTVSNSGGVNASGTVASYSKLQNGMYKLYAAAEDRAGNISVPEMLQEFEIDQNADYPNEPDVSPNGKGLSAIRGKNGLTITGKATDDDGFTGFVASTVQIRFRTTAAGNPWETSWRTIADGTPGNKVELDPTGALIFEYVIPSSLKTGKAYFDEDGEKEYQIRLTDIANNKNPAKKPATVTIENDSSIIALQKIYPTDNTGYSFYLKDTKPEIFFLHYDENSAHPGYNKTGNGARPVFRYHDDSSFPAFSLLPALSGGWVKDNYLELVTVSFDGAAAVPLLTYDRDTGLYANPGGTPYAFGPGAQFNWLLANSAVSSWLPETAFNTSGDGSHTVIITARDVAGNTVSQKWEFYKDTTGPNITLLNIATVQSPPAPVKYNLPVISGDEDSVVITGSFDDDYSAIQSASYQFDGTGFDGVVTITGSSKSVNWSIPIPKNNPPGAFPDGEHHISITAQDALGNSKTVGNLHFVVDRADPTVSDPSTMSVGPASLGTGFPQPLLQEIERVFSAAGASSTSSAVIFTLSGTAADPNLNDVIIALRVGSSSNTALVNVALKGSSLPNGLPEWSAASGPYTSTDIDSENRLTVKKGAVDDEWDWTLNILEKDLAVLQGNASYGDGVSCFVSVNARDLAQRDSGAKHWRFYLDTRAPAITLPNFDRPLDATDPTMTGSVSDDNRVKTIRYYLRKYNYATSKWEYCNAGVWSPSPTDPTPPNPLPWSPYTLGSTPGSFENWTLKGSELDTTKYGTANILSGIMGEGRYELYIEADDYSLGSIAGKGNGNVQSKSAVFYVDRSDPTIAWTDLAKTYYRSKSDGSIELKFTASDPNYLWNTAGDVGTGSFAVSIKKPDGIPYNVTEVEFDLRNFIASNSDPDFGKYKQTITLKPKVNNGLAWPNGKYTVTLTVMDCASKQATVNHTRDITVDNTPPTIEIAGATGTPTGTPLTVTVNEAITGWNKLQGKFTKTNYSPVAFVAFYVAPGGSASPIPGGLPGDDDDIDLTRGSSDLANLVAAGWRYNNGDGNSLLKPNGTTTLMRIEPGLNNVAMVIPDTRNLILNTPSYAGSPTTTTTGVTWNGDKIPQGDEIYDLRIYFLAIDEAGNRSIKVYNYKIYPEGDRPTVTISSPNDQEPEERRLLNGRIRIGGTAKDNVRVKNVWFRILDDLGNPITNRVEIPRWTDTWEAETHSPLYQTPKDNFILGGDNKGDGWFMANGGGKADVSWYAFINTNGELDPDSANKRKIKIEVMAEDTMYDDDADDYSKGDGLPSKAPNKNVSAWVVKGAPEFSEELIKSGKSNVSSVFGEIGINDFTSNGWYPLQAISLRKRASYSVTVTHEAGIKEIIWTPPAGSGINGGNPVDLFKDTVDYDYAAALAAVDAGTSGIGIAVKAGPKSVKTGANQTLTLGKKYLIWKWDKSTANGFTSLIEGSYNAAIDDWRFTTVNGNGATVSLGNNELMEANKDGKFEWVVVADIHADLIEGGKYKYVSGGTGTYSGESPLNLRATENSQSVSLYMNHTAKLPIDNQPPKGAYTHNPYIAGQSATFGGAAGDIGPVSGVARVVLWFSRKNGAAEAPISWNELTSTGSATGNTFHGGGTVPDGVNDAWLGTPNSTSSNMPDLAAYPEKTTLQNWSFIVIEGNDPLGSNTVYGHKRPIGFATVGGDLGISWYVTLDSTLIESGRITAHYIVYDKAGNASYYSQKLVVMNGVPRITRITLATDIRGDKDLTTGGSPVFGLNSNNTYNKTYGDSRANSSVADNFASSPIAAIGTATNNNANATKAQKGVSEAISVNTNDPRTYGPVYDEAFNVRNNLLAVQVEVDQELGKGGKDRTFRVEYVSGAKRLIDSSLGAAGAATATTNGNDFYKQIRAGRIYIVENSGSTINRFPWGSFGAQGDNPPKGSVFMAVENGNEISIPVADYRDGVTAAGLPSVWELNSYYYNSPSNSLARGGVPDKLKLSDVTYSSMPMSGKGMSAEFVYAGGDSNGAFDPSQYPTTLTNNELNVTKIRDFTPTLTTAPADGRPAAYPALTNNAYPWAAHSLFIVRVFGGTEDELFGDFALLSIRVNNDDRTRPYAQLYDLNPKTEGQETPLKYGNRDAQNDTEKQESALSIGSIGGNRTKGGLYNIGTTSKIAKSGHIEPRKSTNLTSAQMGGAASGGTASITKPYVSDKNTQLFATDTVSGDVILRGYVEDDQRIVQVVLKFGGTVNANGTITGGNDITILQGNSSSFGLQAVGATQADRARVAWNETIDLNRHRVEWAYLWSTESIPTTTPTSNIPSVVGNTNVYAIAFNATAALAVKTQSLPVSLNDANATYNYFNPDYAAAMPRYNQISVNLRPYITGFRRNQSAHNTRSRQGWYIFAKGEQVVAAGFNLAAGTNGATNPVIIVGGETAAGIGTANTTALINSHQITGVDDFTKATRYRVFNVGAANGTTGKTGDGIITLTLNNFAAVNTRPGTATAETTASMRPYRTGQTRPYIMPWNIECSPGTDGSELWDDFTQAHIWQSNDTAPGSGEPGRFASRDSALIYNPAMSIDPTNGRLYESHNANGGGNTGADWYNTGRTIKSDITVTTVPNPVTQFSDPIFFSDVYRSPGTSSIAADTWAVSSIIGRSSDYNYWLALGGIYISGTGGGAMQFHGGGTGSTSENNPSIQNSAYCASLYYGESTWYNASDDNTGRTHNPPSTDQFMNPHIVTSYNAAGNQEHIHVSYYDAQDGSIKYRYNLRGYGITMTSDGANGTTNGNYTGANNNTAGGNNARTTYRGIPRMWANLDGGVDDDDVDATTYLNTSIGTNPIDATTRVVRYTTDVDGTKAARGRIVAGKHNSIAVTREGYPVIAYYDETNQRLKLAVSRSVAPILAADWVIRDFVIPEDNYNCVGTGEFVSMKIDTRGDTSVVHIAAMNTNKRLVYVTGKLNPTAGTGNREEKKDGVLTEVKVQVVDSVGNVGRWCALSLDASGNPWISYMDESYIGARDGAKVAFLNKTTFYKGVDNGNDANSYFRGEYIDLYGASLEGWETMHVPTTYRVENPAKAGREHGRLGMECYPARNVDPEPNNNRIWSAAVGYLSTDLGMDRYRVAYYVK